MISGVLLLDKPEGLSSNAALQRVKRLTGARKAGHVGSLDPLATGMLPICLGEATKIAGDLLGGRKRYRFRIALGARTDTGDREGAVVETLPVPGLEAPLVEAVLARFRGRQSQVPPMYSALKRGGQPLYRLARAGVEVERAPRQIEIDELAALAPDAQGLAAEAQGSADARALRDAPVLPDAPELELEALCSKGTYIRVLGEDIARALGTCGHIARLRRLYVEPFEGEPMQALDAVEAMCRAGRMPPLIAADRALPALPTVTVPATAAMRLGRGQAVESPEPRLAGRVRIYDDQGRFLGLGEADGQGAVRPKRMFVLVAGGGSG